MPPPAVEAILSLFMTCRATLSVWGRGKDFDQIFWTGMGPECRFDPSLVVSNEIWDLRLIKKKHRQIQQNKVSFLTANPPTL